MKIGTDFSGIGSPESALKRLGLDIEEVFACEIDKYARKSFNELHNPTTFYEDITTRNHSEVPQLDLYIAGFPCQSFSMAGKRGGFEDTRGTLFFNVAEFIKENQPKCFVLENVKGLLSHDSGKTYQTITDVLTNGGGTLNGQIGIDAIDNGLGYHVYAKVLNTKDYGVPQNRERIFLVGFKEPRDFNFPKKMELKLRLKDLLQDTPKVSNDNNFVQVDEKYYLSDKRIGTITKSNRSIGFTNTDKKNVSNCLIASYYLLPTDGEYIQVPEKYYLSDKMIENFTYSKNNISGVVGDLNKGGERGVVYSNDCTVMSCLTATDYKQPKQIQVIQTNNKRVVASNKSHIYKTKRIRKLTPLECWRLQGFTDEQFYKAQKVNSDTQLYKQAGNSITVNVLVELFKKIYLCKN
tara:strand:+ start:1312 stop:2535 length:1224 start_codon:yes stop_codon:yes gene_type:complete